ncbi:PREDICTED: uncharacterized protein K02A2.6-like [Camelina sativa]|uniref:Uncharacterized protein K02A2.6-like n=1 Tax=Camelina sativa TaxID=90675 RepID=A0ABM0V6W6_CAMSA|nr:PREDICTED: uncharacterized protein K02A2.6-like [Camelina sativa]
MKDHFPLPFIDQMLEPLANHPYYCFLDGYSGFFQIPIHPDDQEKMTFTCPYGTFAGTFAYRRMPFGLCNALATFQRCMMSIFSDLIEDIMEVFMDDFSVYGSSFSSCLSNLCKVLQCCVDKHLVLNWEKCHFMVSDGIVLGHQISEKGIEVDKAKIELDHSPNCYARTSNGVADHLFRLRIDAEIPIDDWLPEENVYVDAAYEECFKDEADAKVLQQISDDSPWYADIANYLCAAEDPPNFTGYAKKKFLRDVQRYFWNEPYLYKHCADGLYIRCVPESEVSGILFHYHRSNYAGYFATFKTATKVLQAGLWWPTLSRDAHDFVSRCDACQRRGNISKRNEMPHNFILDIEVFHCWGINFMGPFPPSYGNLYILVAIDYVSKWVEALASPTNDSKVVISDGGTHFINKLFENLLKKHGVTHKTAYNTPIGTTPFKLVYGKSCHLPVEFEYNSLWATKQMKFNVKTAAERRLIQLNELDEIRMNAYESTKIYKERTKEMHDKKIVPKNFAAYDLVLLFNSRLKIFPGKLRSRWSGPFRIKEVMPYGAIVLWNHDGKEFTVNGQRLKPYLADHDPTEESTIPLMDLHAA